MSKRQRDEFPGAINHVTARGNNGRPIFTSNSDRTQFLDILATIAAKRRWICHAYCLMGNHYHLLIQTLEPDLGAGMRHLNGRYAVGFNHRSARKEHLFGERYHPAPIRTDAHLLEAARYILLNPVRAGICGRPGDWRWSSFRATMGETPMPPYLESETLLSFFGNEPKRAREMFRLFIGEGLPENVNHDSLSPIVERRVEVTP